MNHISLFSGIGGFDLASEWMGWNNIVSCEINDFCNKVLSYYWPKAYHQRDIHSLTYRTIKNEIRARLGRHWRRSTKLILTGGFPCQPYSVAGKRKGDADDRHLWPEMLRVIREVKPDWIVGENVPGFANWSDGLVLKSAKADLENAGYEVTVFNIPACGKDAPHKRERIWIVANANKIKFNAAISKNGKNKTNGQHKKKRCSGWEKFKLVPGVGYSNIGFSVGENIEPAIIGSNDGISIGLDRTAVKSNNIASIEAYGNSVVPQVVFEIFQAIKEFDEMNP